MRSVFCAIDVLPNFFLVFYHSWDFGGGVLYCVFGVNVLVDGVWGLWDGVLLVCWGWSSLYKHRNINLGKNRVTLLPPAHWVHWVHEYLHCVKRWYPWELPDLGSQVSPSGLQGIRATEGVFNLSNQPSNFSENRGMQRSKREFIEFQGLILSHYCYSHSKIAMITTTSPEKHVKFLK